MSTATNPKPILDPSSLYFGDNGRCHCGDPRCAGMTAAYTGRGLDGEPVILLSASLLLAEADWDYQDVARLRCEGCDKGIEMEGSTA